jgi:predicted nucleotidyltransferase
MRLDKHMRKFIKDGLHEIEGESKVLLFGSRADDSRQGGDIDILWLTSVKIPQRRIREFKRELYKKFGWQKIDIVNFTHGESDPFRNIAQQKAIEI